MPVLDLHRADSYLFFREEECVAAGEALHQSYVDAEPFPHVVIEDFLDPALLRDIAARYPSRDNKTFFDRPQERLKYQFNPVEIDSGVTRNLLAELNGQPFLRFLQALTGIRGLIADPYFSGGGLHETRNGGHLSVHADFNVHGGMKVERRLNLLIYLNDDWSDDFGGALELWDKAMTAPQKRIAPVLGRAVIFNTSLDSFHGQPDPLNCPPERSRRSIATYYYTAFESGVKDAPERTTTFQTRPGSADRTDWQVRYQHFVDDWMPRRLHRIAKRVNPWR